MRAPPKSLFAPLKVISDPTPDVTSSVVVPVTTKPFVVPCVMSPPEVIERFLATVPSARIRLLISLTKTFPVLLAAMLKVP